MTGTTAPADTDRDLLHRVAAGDERSLGLLYDRHAGAVMGLALRITGEHADAEEVVLETFAQAWREAGRFRPERGSVAAWLTMIGRSRALDLVRARGRRARLAEQASRSDPHEVPGMGAWRPAADSAAEHAERRARVSEALERLSDDQRQAIELAFFAGLSQSEIASRLATPLGTVKTRVRLGMQKLREALRTSFFEHDP